jgi:hypothetical protein
MAVRRRMAHQHGLNYGGVAVSAARPRRLHVHKGASGRRSRLAAADVNLAPRDAGVDPDAAQLLPGRCGCSP